MTNRSYHTTIEVPQSPQDVFERIADVRDSLFNFITRAKVIPRS